MDAKSLEKRLSALKDTTEDIQSLSRWCIQHRTHHNSIVQAWSRAIRKAKVGHRLTLFYVCNDVVQNAKRKKCKDLVQYFGTAIKEAAHLVRDERIKKKIVRIFTIWEERGIYDKNLIVELISIVEKVGTVENTEKDLVISTFQLSSLVESIHNMIAVEKDSSKHLNSLQIQEHLMSEDEVHKIVLSVKERGSNNDKLEAFNKSVAALEDYISTVQLEIDERTILVAKLEQAEIFYETQRGEAKLVATAYKKFSGHLKHLKNKLKEKIDSLPEKAPSPIPSPPENAPSPDASDEEVIPGLPDPEKNSGMSSFMDSKISLDSYSLSDKPAPRNGGFQDADERQDTSSQKVYLESTYKETRPMNAKELLDTFGGSYSSKPKVSPNPVPFPLPGLPSGPPPPILPPLPVPKPFIKPGGLSIPLPPTDPPNAPSPYVPSADPAPSPYAPSTDPLYAPPANTNTAPPPYLPPTDSPVVPSYAPPTKHNQSYMPPLPPVTSQQYAPQSSNGNWEDKNMWLVPPPPPPLPKNSNWNSYEWSGYNNQGTPDNNDEEDDRNWGEPPGTDELQAYDIKAATNIDGKDFLVPPAPPPPVNFSNRKRSDDHSNLVNIKPLNEDSFNYSKSSKPISDADLFPGDDTDLRVKKKGVIQNSDSGSDMDISEGEASDEEKGRKRRKGTAKDRMISKASVPVVDLPKDQEIKPTENPVIISTTADLDFLNNPLLETLDAQAISNALNQVRSNDYVQNVGQTSISPVPVTTSVTEIPKQIDPVQENPSSKPSLTNFIKTFVSESRPEKKTEYWHQADESNNVAINKRGSNYEQNLMPPQPIMPIRISHDNSSFRGGYGSPFRGQRRDSFGDRGRPYGRSLGRSRPVNFRGRGRWNSGANYW